MKSNRKYWQSFGEMADSEAHRSRVLKKELSHHKKVPMEEMSGASLSREGTSRRDFLKYLGFSTAAAVLAASCERPVRKAVPFFNRPNHVVPGQAVYYATTCTAEGGAVPVIAKVRDGRPIKLAGNTRSAHTLGATSARVQASLLGLYDTNRLREPQHRNTPTDEWKRLDEHTLAQFDKAFAQRLRAKSGKIALVLNNVNSPTSQHIVSAFQNMYQAEVIWYDSISYGGLLEANQITYGRRALPVYQLDRAEVVVGVGADFLGTWYDASAQSAKWVKTRAVRCSDPSLSKHYQFESLMSLTGANCDERFVVRPSEYPAIVLGLYALLHGGDLSPTLSAPLSASVRRVADHLRSSRGKAVVLCGSNDPQVQVVVNAINEKLGAREHIIDFSRPVDRRAKDELLANFVDGLKAQKYDTVIFAAEANPVYESVFGQQISQYLPAVPQVVSLGSHMDETAAYAHYLIPDHHYLESWGDVQIAQGSYAFQQPTINPLFRTRNWQTSLLKWMGSDHDYGTYVQQQWARKFSRAQWDKVIQDGMYEEKATGKIQYTDKAVAAACRWLEGVTVQNGVELQLYEKIGIGSGKMAGNPWLQELPDPITRATWDNYAVISPAMAQQIGVVVDDTYEVECDKPVLHLSDGTEQIELPLLVIPGVHPQVVGIALGYGRTETLGKAVLGVGKRAVQFARYENGIIHYDKGGIQVRKLDKTYPIAYTQTHNSYEGRQEVIREFSLEEFQKDPDVLLRKREELYGAYGNGVKDEQTYIRDATLYPSQPENGVRWGLSLDLNLCFGCGACVVSCNAENNISVVGKKQVMKSHEMHWLRIDRYFSGSVDNPEVVFQPMMCQHCDHAPCENVCPVGATMHSAEGINHMAYNRCVGTRYCANNCPYKVRRFNWLDWMGTDSFPDNQRPLVEEGSLDAVVLDMNSTSNRMVLNPDVVVRSRGVIEKCSLCIQRLQEGKRKAKKEGRPVQDGDVTLACSEACPTDAIVFGNVNDPKSKISRLRGDDQKRRVFYVLEQLHILPNVNYLAKIRNKNG